MGVWVANMTILVNYVTTVQSKIGEGADILYSKQLGLELFAKKQGIWILNHIKEKNVSPMIKYQLIQFTTRGVT